MIYIIYDLLVKTRSGEDYALGNLKGKVIVVVNTATADGAIATTEAIKYSNN